MMCQGSHKNATTFRTLFYPSLADSAIKAGVERCGKHSDYGTFTLLFQDDIGGLEVIYDSMFLFNIDIQWQSLTGVFRWRMDTSHTYSWNSFSQRWRSNAILDGRSLSSNGMLSENTKRLLITSLSIISTDSSCPSSRRRDSSPTSEAVIGFLRPSR